MRLDSEAIKVCAEPTSAAVIAENMIPYAAFFFFFFFFAVVKQCCIRVVVENAEPGMAVHY